MITAVIVLVAAAVALFVLRTRNQSPAEVTACGQPSTIGKPVAGSTITVCDAGTGRKVRLSLSGLPSGKRVALQADDAAFVLADSTLWWAPVTGQGTKWASLGTVPAGAQALCLSGPSVVVAAAPTGSAGPANKSWTEVTVPAKAPVALATPSHVPSNPCAGGVSR
jgi:hypothetical protein